MKALIKECAAVREAEPKKNKAKGQLAMLRLTGLLLLCSFAASANVCTPLNVPLNGPFPAVVNGIDALDWGVARIQWTSDATGGTPATGQRMQYATAAQWAANPGVYPQTQGMGSVFVNSSTTIQGSVLPNLLPGTTYHVIGQSYQGGAWCTASDETFTTPAAPVSTVLPNPPAQFLTTTPAMTYTPTMNGTHWVYGSNCGGGSSTVAVNLNDCLQRAQPGDDIGLPPGTYQTTQTYTLTNPNAVQITSCTTNGSTCTVAGTAPANGTQLRFYQPPSPINQGVTYKVMNASGSTFRISYDGVNPITLLNTGGSPMFYVVWPLTQSYVTIHSTASASQLPPPGVRLGPDSMAQYSPYMPNIQAIDPFQEPMIAFGALGSYYWFQNIIFSTDPSIGTTKAGNGVDPVGFGSYMQTVATDDHIVFNQCAFLPAPPPSRSWFLEWDGSNIGLLNSYVSGFDFWQPARVGSASTVTSSSITISPTVYNWVGTGGPAGTRKSCTYPGGSLNITGGGSGYYLLYMDPTTCGLDAQVTTGITASGTNVAVSNVASPAYPTYTYTAPPNSGAHVYTGYNVLTVGDGSVTNGSINVGSYNERFGLTGWSTDLEGGGGFHVGTGPGPYMTVNNYIQCAGICGMFFSDDMSNGSSPCGWQSACPVQYNIGDVTEQRNTITTNPCYFEGNSCWNGGNYSWRNMDEVKTGIRIWQDGNIWGPYYAQIGQGECGGSHYEYNGLPNFIPITSSSGQPYPSYVNSSDWTYTNNTCNAGASAGIYTGLYYYAEWPNMPIKNIRVHNNLFLNVNGYAQTSPKQPLQAQVQQSNSLSNCPYGRITQWDGNGQNFDFDHNTVYGEAGCLAVFEGIIPTRATGTNFSNNILNLVSDPGVWSGYTKSGTLYQTYAGLQGGTADVPSCDNLQGTALFACMTNFTWAGNVIRMVAMAEIHPDSRPFALGVDDFGRLCHAYMALCAEFPELQGYDYRSQENAPEWRKTRQPLEI